MSPGMGVAKLQGLLFSAAARVQNTLCWRFIVELFNSGFVVHMASWSVFKTWHHRTILWWFASSVAPFLRWPLVGWQCGCLPSRTENGHYRVSGPSGLLNDSLFSSHSGCFTAEKAEAGDSEWFASGRVNCGCLSTHHSASSDLGVCSSRTPQTCSCLSWFIDFPKCPQLRE